MPNHCTNYLEFIGSSNDFSAMQDYIAGSNTVIDFEQIIPSGDTTADVLDWRRENWGTKWNAYEASFRKMAKQQHPILQFDTAWNSPAPILAQIGREFPGLKINHYSLIEDFEYAEIAQFKSGRRAFYLEEEYGEWISKFNPNSYIHLVNSTFQRPQYVESLKEMIEGSDIVRASILNQYLNEARMDEIRSGIKITPASVEAVHTPIHLPPTGFQSDILEFIDL